MYSEHLSVCVCVCVCVCVADGAGGVQDAVWQAGGSRGEEEEESRADGGVHYTHR